MRRRPLSPFLVLQLSLHSPVFLLETSQQTDCTSTFVPSPSRSRSLLLLFFFFEREGREGGRRANRIQFIQQLFPDRGKKKSGCEVSSGCICFGTACPCPLDLIHLLGEDGVGRRKRGWPDASQAVCRALLQTGRAHPGTHSRLWRCTMEESAVYTVLSEQRSISTDWTHSCLVKALIYWTVHCLDSRGFNKRFYVFDGRRRTL